MRVQRVLAGMLGAVLALSGARTAAATDPMVTWFASDTCPALDGLYSKKEPPAVKTGDETLVVDVPSGVLDAQTSSMTKPWYVYDPKSGIALSHIGGDSGVVWTLRYVKGAPPAPVPHVDLSGAHTSSGIKLGASAASVVRALGTPLVIHACGMERYEYNDTKDTQAEPNDLDFTIRNGRVIEIVHTSWG
jgi:hypothetical protein